MRITIFVSAGDKLSDLCNALKEFDLPGVKAKIKRQGQINDCAGYSAASVNPFEGTIQEVLAHLYETAKWSSGWRTPEENVPRNRFALPTVVDVWKE